MQPLPRCLPARLYLALSGAAVAAQRSFIMLAVMLTALLFDRAALTMRNLAISALIIIAVFPHEVTGPSFHMSFAATASLIGAYASVVGTSRAALPEGFRAARQSVAAVAHPALSALFHRRGWR